MNDELTLAVTPLSADEIRDLLAGTLHGPLPARTMHRVFATLARIAELEAELADYRGGSAWVHTWLVAEKFRKPDVPRIVEAAKRHYRKTLENSKALEAENEKLKAELWDHLTRDRMRRAER